MDFYLHIKPSFDCVLNYYDNQKSLIKNKTYSFILKDKTALSFYPSFSEELNSLPFSCILEPFNENSLQTNMSNLTLTRFPNNNFLLEVNPFIFANSPVGFGLKTKVIRTQNTPHTISWFSNNYLNCRIENSTNYLDFRNNCKVTDMEAKIKDGNILIYFRTQNSKFVTCHILYENNKYFLQEMQEVDLLEGNENTITTYKNLHDYANHGEITTYSFENAFNKTKELAYNNQKPTITKIKEFVPFAFFEALKNKNFKLARNYLSPALSSKLSNNHLNKFFGNFEKPYQTLSPEYNPEEIALIYYSKPVKYAKVYNIKFNNENKIENIEES